MDENRLRLLRALQLTHHARDNIIVLLKHFASVIAMQFLLGCIRIAITHRAVATANGNGV